MSLDGNVFPGIQTALQTLISTNNGGTGQTSTSLQGFSMGPRTSAASTPWCWIQADGFAVAEPQGSDLESTDWDVVLRFFHKWASDKGDAETKIAGLVEPFRAAIRAHVKLGQPTVARAFVSRGSWGYMELNGIFYRYVDLTVAVREKGPQVYNP